MDNDFQHLYEIGKFSLIPTFFELVELREKFYIALTLCSSLVGSELQFWYNRT